MKKKPFILILLLGCAALFSACSHNSDQVNTASKKDTLENSQAPQKSIQTDTADTEATSTINESNYNGEDLNLVKIINKSIQFRNEGKEKEYLSLLAENSPVTKMSSTKIKDVQVDRMGDSNKDQVEVHVSYIHEDDSKSSENFVMRKQENHWLIYDID